MKIRKATWFLLLLFAITSPFIFGKDVNLDKKNQVVFRFARHYSDHMVLPASPQKAVIWGYGEMGQIVHILYQGTPYLTTVNREVDGEAVWSFVLPSTSPGGPFSIAASSKAGESIYALTLKDVLFGDIWLCGGQSNMQFTVGQALKAEDEFAIADNYPDIRLLTVARIQSNVPLYDFPENGIEQSWTKPSRQALYEPVWQHFSAICWMFGRKLYDEFKRPIGLISSNWGGTNIEAWSSPDVLKSCGVKGKNSERKNIDELNGPHAASVLWNAMIHPLLQSNLYGVVWYQGEDNAETSQHYYCLFPAMIADWRKKWYGATRGLTDDHFPFGFVQLGPNGTDRTYIDGFPTIRFAQTARVGYVPNRLMPRTFMAVAMDLPDLSSPYGSIHPRDKTDVAQRLFLGALSEAYHKNVKWTGPLLEKVYLAQVNNTVWELTIVFNKRSVSAGGLDIKSSTGVEVLFVYKNQSVWKPVILSSWRDNIVASYFGMPAGTHLEAVRYGWRAYPCLFKHCAIYERGTGLPSPPWLTTGPFAPSSLFLRLPIIKNYL